MDTKPMRIVNVADEVFATPVKRRRRILAHTHVTLNCTADPYGCNRKRLSSMHAVRYVFDQSVAARARNGKVCKDIGPCRYDR